jgi:hypothetical protein
VFGPVAALESQWLINLAKSKRGDNPAFEPLSEQEFMDCNIVNVHACDGGPVDLALDYAKQKGMVLASAYYRDYHAAVGVCPPGESYPRVFLNGYHYVRPLKLGDVGSAEETIARVLIAYGPVVCILDLCTSLLHYKSGVFDPTSGVDLSDYNRAAHALLIVGYDRVRAPNIGGGKKEKWVDYWVIKNSWGESWGLNGYLHLRRGVNAMGIATKGVYVLDGMKFKNSVGE